VKLTNQGESKRGRPRKISYNLIRRLAGHLHAGCDIRTACNLCQVGEQTYRDWQERAENNEEPYAKLFSVASRARDGFKTQLLKPLQMPNDSAQSHGSAFIGFSPGEQAD
jgi:hypothetical protein